VTKGAVMLMMLIFQAHELNVLVAGAFRTAYAHSQSPSMSSRHAAIDTQRLTTADTTANHHHSSSHRAKSESPPMTGITTQNVSVHRTATAPVFNDTSRNETAGPLSTAQGPSTTLVGPASSTSGPWNSRLTGVTAQNVGVHRTATAPVFSDTGRNETSGPAAIPGPSTTISGPSNTTAGPWTSRLIGGPIASNTSTGSSTSIPGPSTISGPSTTIPGPPWTNVPGPSTTTAVNPVSSLSDMSLMSTLLSALRNSSVNTTSAALPSGSAGSGGSPVMILKELIDKHFSDIAAAAAAVTSSPVTNNSQRLPTVNNSHVCIIARWSFCCRVIIRDHSFPRITEFRAEPRNLPISTEFLCFPGTLRNSALASDNGTNNGTFWSVSGGRK